MSEEAERMDVREKEIIEDPYTDVDGMVDLLIADDPVPKVKEDPDIVVREHLSEQDKVRNGEKKDKGDPILSGPLTIPKIDEDKMALDVNLRRSTALDQLIGNPIDNDNLVSTIRDECPTSTVLNAIMEEIAEEAAHIKAWRNANWDAGKDLSDATFRRIKMLKELVLTLSEKEKLRKEKNVGKVDFHGESFQRVLKYFLETILTTFRAVNIPVQYEDIFFTQLAKTFDGFEKKAEKIYYGTDK